MKRFAAVTVLGLGLFFAGHAEAGRLPQGELLVGRLRVWRPAHSVAAQRGPVASPKVEKIGQFRPAHSVADSAR